MKRQQKKSFFPKTKKSKQNDHNISSADISDNEISNDKSKDSIDIINYPIIIDNEEQLIAVNDKSKDSIDIINYPIIIDNEEQLITVKDKSKDSIDIINYPIIIDNEEQLITANDNIVQIENNSIMEDVNLNVSSELSDNGDNNNDNKHSDNDDISSSDISEIT